MTNCLLVAIHADGCATRRGHVSTLTQGEAMSRHLGRLGKFVVGAAIAGGLGFGATQAFAAPSESAAAACTDHDICDNYCTNNGYLAGKCMNWACYCLTPQFTWVRVWS